MNGQFYLYGLPFVTETNVQMFSPSTAFTTARASSCKRQMLSQSVIILDCQFIADVEIIVEAVFIFVDDTHAAIG